MESLVEYLASKGIATRPGSGHEVTAECFLGCMPRPGKRKWYGNTETWLWSCKTCDSAGNRKTLLAHFGDEDEATYLPGANPATKLEILDLYTTVCSELLAANDEMLTYLIKRGLNADTIEAARLGYHPRGYSVLKSMTCGRSGGYSHADLKATGLLREDGSEFLAGLITIPYLQHSRVLQVRGKDAHGSRGGKYFTCTGDTTRLYGTDTLHDAEQAMVVEGEFDALLLGQTLAGAADPKLRHMGIVAVPGASTLPDGFEAAFTQCKRVFLGYDGDDAGRKGAVKAKEALGSKARTVELPAPDGAELDWTDYLRTPGEAHPHGGHTWRDVAALITTADMTGRRIFSVSEVAASWRADKIATPGLKFGYPSLDSVLAPGLKPGNVAIPLAKTGVGKTVFLANVAYNLRSVPSIHITLENTKEEFFELLWRIYHFHNPGADDFNIERDFPNLAIFDENRLTIDDFGLLLEEYEEQFGVKPQYCSLDYLGYMANMQRGSGPYEKNTQAVMLIKEMAKHARLSLVAPAQVNRSAKKGGGFEGDEARDAGTIEETADFLFGLYRPQDAVDAANALAPGRVTHEMHAQILKSRRGGAGKVARLGISHASLVIVDANDSVAMARVQQENAAVNRGLKYAEIYAEQRQVAYHRAQLRVI